MPQSDDQHVSDALEGGVREAQVGRDRNLSARSLVS